MENEKKGIKNAPSVHTAERRGPSEGNSMMQNFGNYFQGFSSYLPTLKKQSNSNPSEERDIILWSSFDNIEIGGKTCQVLVIAYNNGFQVWNVEDTDNIYEMISKRDNSIRCAKILPSPLSLETQQNPFYGKRPLMAIASSAEMGSNFPNVQVKLYSLKTNEYVNILRFRSEVCSVSASRRLLVVGLRDHIHGFDSLTVERVFTLDCFCGPGHVPGVLALGSRWLAYPGNIPFPNNKVSTASDKIVEVAKDVAKDIASGLYYLGQKTYTDYMNYQNPDSTGLGIPVSNSNNVHISKSPTDGNMTDYNEISGSVIVYDAVSMKNVSHFKPHSQPISAMAFDPSGSLLVTASIDGRYFNVFRVSPDSPNVVNSNIKHLYKLQRGVTPASIQSISFSADSRWIAVNSIRGTTHIFAINPTGGPVNVHTHLRTTNSHRLTLYPLVTDQTPPLVVLSSLFRVKNGVSMDESMMRLPSIASTCEFVGHPFATEKMYVFTQFGVLTQHQLKPSHPSPAPEQDPTVLQLMVEPIIEWDVGRRTKWPELPFSLPQSDSKASNQMKPLVNIEKKDEKSTKLEPESQWLSSVEICTHSPHLRPLWASPQFAFKTFQQDHVENPNVYFEQAPTKKVEVKHVDPTPFREK
eukprot:TRINITY_DN3459_c0_g1_i4.p1 TRINITY_DN3459_c0_g1~~TRINITY_DN3459_c0_g1_i4.p1  ORF type:complete len:637 (+),score=100.50 TRINITY_DN3459_c0_g1_i4:166-2076(+)